MAAAKIGMDRLMLRSYIRYDDHELASHVQSSHAPDGDTLAGVVRRFRPHRVASAYRRVMVGLFEISVAVANVFTHK